MQVLGIRFCSVSEEGAALAHFLRDILGIPPLYTMDPGVNSEEHDSFEGTIFPAGDSWIEVWPEGPGMPAGVMLQIIVDDADKWAEHARSNGAEPQGPVDAHNERIYFFTAPTGLAITIQSKIDENEKSEAQ